MQWEGRHPKRANIRLRENHSGMGEGKDKKLKTDENQQWGKRENPKIMIDG
jgi:hypothetical protein